MARDIRYLLADELDFELRIRGICSEDIANVELKRSILRGHFTAEQETRGFSYPDVPMEFEVELQKCRSKLTLFSGLVTNFFSDKRHPEYKKLKARLLHLTNRLNYIKTSDSNLADTKAQILAQTLVLIDKLEQKSETQVNFIELEDRNIDQNCVSSPIQTVQSESLQDCDEILNISSSLRLEDRSDVSIDQDRIEPLNVELPTQNINMLPQSNAHNRSVRFEENPCLASTSPVRGVHDQSNENNGINSTGISASQPQNLLLHEGGLNQNTNSIESTNHNQTFGILPQSFQINSVEPPRQTPHLLSNQSSNLNQVLLPTQTMQGFTNHVNNFSEPNNLFMDHLNNSNLFQDPNNQNLTHPPIQVTSMQNNYTNTNRSLPGYISANQGLANASSSNFNRHQMVHNPYEHNYRFPPRLNLKFNGKGQSLHSFLEKVDEFCLAHKINKNTVLNFAHEIFEGDALIWYRAVRNQIQSWDELVRMLCLDFLPFDFDIALWDEIRARTQGLQERPLIYIAIMENLFKRFISPVHESVQLKLIITNLLPYYQQQLALSKPHNLNELKNICRILENTKIRSEKFQPPPPCSSTTLEPELAYRKPFLRSHYQNKNPQVNEIIAPNNNITLIDNDNFQNPRLSTISNSVMNTNILPANQTSPIQVEFLQNSAVNSNVSQTRTNLNSEIGAQIEAIRSNTSKCWNCEQVGHSFRECKQKRKLFCYGCGLKNVRKPQCNNCSTKNGGIAAFQSAEAGEIQN